MTEQQQSIVSRVKKLLALAEGNANEHESAAALAAAQRLMTEHAIETAMLEEPELDQAAPDEEIVNFSCWDDALDNSTRQRVTWKIRLSVNLANHNGVKVYTRGGTIHLVGRPSDVATVRYLYGYCVREIERLTTAQGRGHGRTWYNNYRLGVVDGIAEKLTAMKRDLLGEMREKANRQGGAALVRINTAIEKVEERRASVERWAQQNMNLGRARASYSRYDGSARERGRRDGKSINLGGGKGLGSGSRKQLKS